AESAPATRFPHDSAPARLDAHGTPLRRVSRLGRDPSRPGGRSRVRDEGHERNPTRGRGSTTCRDALRLGSVSRPPSCGRGGPRCAACQFRRLPTPSASGRTCVSTPASTRVSDEQESPWGPLRAWQREALERYLAAKPRDFLAVATPGAGKTTFALTVAAHLLARRVVERVIVVTPTEHLKRQWAEAAH